MSMNSAILWNMTSCNSAEFHRHCERKQCLRLQGKNTQRQPPARRKHSAQSVTPLATHFLLGYLVRNVGKLPLDDKVSHILSHCCEYMDWNKAKTMHRSKLSL